jgi:chitinase
LVVYVVCVCVCVFVATLSFTLSACTRIHTHSPTGESPFKLRTEVLKLKALEKGLVVSSGASELAITSKGRDFVALKQTEINF